MNPAFDSYLAECRQRCEAALPELLGGPQTAGGSAALETLFEASRYSLMNGGKRVRPVLVYAAAEAVAGSAQHPALDHAACAMEMVHVYSLVHDDLPAMDNDDLRRGRPSCHRAYNEATAILVGDGLQARATELLAEAPGLEDAQRVAMIGTLAAAAGPSGMVGGQALDVAATGSDLDLDQLRCMHRLKTGALIRAALALGGITARASQNQLRALESYGDHIGLAFQVVDDILDVVADRETLGKTPGKDRDADKPTYVKLLGLAGARAESERLLELAHGALEAFDECAGPLRGLATYIVRRPS